MPDCLSWNRPALSVRLYPPLGPPWGATPGGLAAPSLNPHSQRAVRKAHVLMEALFLHLLMGIWDREHYYEKVGENAL